MINNNNTKMEMEVKIRNYIELEKELEGGILNIEDLFNGYTDTVYQFIIDTSVFYVAAQHETEGLDIIIDFLESEGMEGYFIDDKIYKDDYIIDTEGDKYFSDEYVIGGNHGLILYHGGNFRIEELSI